MNSRRLKLWRWKILRLLIVVAGIVAGQFVLFGPSLIGKKILLPLDILAAPDFYIPNGKQIPQNSILADLVVYFEPARQFSISEFHSGRMPLWNPRQFIGSPVVYSKFSPYFLLSCATPSPVILAWVQLTSSIVAGLGIYAFFRRSLRVSFWAATIPAWCFPLTGFFVFWAGFGVSYPVTWLPWLLLAVQQTVRGGKNGWPILLSVLTGLVLVSGSPDIAGQVLLISGFYALWCIGDKSGSKWLWKPVCQIAARLTFCWILGFLLACPHLLPFLEYTHTGARMERRAAGSEERPPVGLSALPQIVLPDFYGTSDKGSLFISRYDSNQLESVAAAYTGFWATLLVAPLAWFSRRHRSINLFWLGLGIFCLGWILNIPGIVTLLRLPGLNMMSHNRFIFGTSLAILALAATGLDALGRYKIQRRLWFFLPTAGLLTLMILCLYRSLILPEPLATQLAARLNLHDIRVIGLVPDLNSLRQIQEWFVFNYRLSAALCGLGLLGWALLLWQPRWPQWTVLGLGFCMLGDLWWFAHGRNVQSDLSHYYPRIPALEKIHQGPPGRVVGYNCLPASLAQTHELHDLRGYDAVDPARFIDLIRLVDGNASKFLTEEPYALTQWFVPGGIITTNDICLSPVLGMLGVRYVIFRGQPDRFVPGTHPFSQSPDYWVLTNRNALQRMFVPHHVEVITNSAERLQKIASPQFAPLKMAYVETPVQLPAFSQGQAEIVYETPQHIAVSVQMTNSGLVVLSDLWDKGWVARLNGQTVPVLRVNHALRGVVAPAGTSILEFSYEPASFYHGLYLAGLALAILLAWWGRLCFRQK